MEKGWETRMVPWGKDGIERKGGSCIKERFMGKGKIEGKGWDRMGWRESVLEN